MRFFGLMVMLKPDLHGPSQTLGCDELQHFAALQEDHFYRWCTYLFVPLRYAGILFACWCWCWVRAPMATGEKIALAMAVGVVAGVGMNAAHDLGHKSKTHERWLAKIVLAQSLYGCCYVENIHGHHITAATPQYPASADSANRSGYSFPAE